MAVQADRARMVLPVPVQEMGISVTVSMATPGKTAASVSTCAKAIQKHSVVTH